ncbi:hypothetical protein U879_03230 [Defluviimonas sp. 20V17]|nr:hypothetical protein U879_03230 [Defluviimonas sp. 20V17]
MRIPLNQLLRDVLCQMPERTGANRWQFSDCEEISFWFLVQIQLIQINQRH